MNIKIAKTAGFCFGVKRAIDIVLDVSNRTRSPIFTDGPLIHNPQIVKALESRNVTALDEKAMPANATLIIRAHGVSPERREFLEKNCSKVFDGTCPLVSRIHKIVEREINNGRRIIIIGESGHPEVIGILGFSNNSGVVINDISEAESLPEYSEPVSVVAQTTQEIAHYEEIKSYLTKKYQDIAFFDTICNATEMRQNETASLAHEVDLMVVVGGKNSGNTKRLAEVSRKNGSRTVLVETEEEISKEDIGDAETVGITAGASTPNWMIRNVAQRIEDIANEKKDVFTRFSKKFVNFLIDSDIYIGIGAFSMAYVASTLISHQVHFFESGLAALYIFSMHTLNRFIDREAWRYNNSRRSKIYEKYMNYVLAGGILASAAVTVLSLTRGFWLFLFYLLCSVTGVLYSINFVPVQFRPLVRYASLKDIPGSRDIFISAAWATVLTISPVVSGKWIFEWRLLFTFSIIFIFAFCRTIILDIKDIQGDSIVGKETIPTLIENRYSVIINRVWDSVVPSFSRPIAAPNKFSALLIKMFLLAGVTILIAAVLVNEYEYYSLALIVNFLYLLWAVNKFSREGSYYGNYIEGFTDFNFILCGMNLFVVKWFLILF